VSKGVSEWSEWSVGGLESAASFKLRFVEAVRMTFKKCRLLPVDGQRRTVKGALFKLLFAIANFESHDLNCISVRKQKNLCLLSCLTEADP
jgi:hypothetical protein